MARIHSVVNKSRRLAPYKLVGSLLLFFSLLAVLTLVACGGSGGVSGGTDTGTLALSLQDAFTDSYQAVYVTINEVQVHMGGDDADEGNWEVIASPYQTYNLLDLANGVREELGLTELTPGHYTQVRLIIGEIPDSGLNIFSQPHPYANYVILMEDDSIHELKIPSGIQTGIKIVHGFDVNLNETTELILDFDAMHSVVRAGASDNWLLKPTIKVLSVEDSSIISGIVTDEDTSNPVPGAVVSAQVFDDGAADEADKVIVQTATVTDGDGAYSLFVAPGTYNIVAYADTYLPACANETTNAGDSLVGTDLQLPPSTELDGTVTGSVTIPGDGDEQYATISFRQTLSCGGGDATGEITSINVAESVGFSEQLPPGDYQVVVSSYQMTTYATDITITADTESPLGEIALTEAP